MARLIAVADTDAEAEEVARRGTEWLAAAYMNPSKVTKPSSPDQKTLLMMDRDAQLSRYLNSVVIQGCPERVADHIHRLRTEMSLDYLMCVPLSHSSFMQFTENVMPRFI